MMQDLGAGGGVASFAYGINDAGQIVGYSLMASGAERAFFYDAGMMMDLGTFDGMSSYAFDINSAGQAVGYAFTGAGDYHAFLYSGGSLKDLGTLGGSSAAYGINNLGQLAARRVISGRGTEEGREQKQNARRWGTTAGEKQYPPG